MSYIAFDLDALNVCPQVGAACGLAAAEASHGLLQLWAWCFRTECEIATDVHLRGFFQGRDAGPALEAFGFLQRTEGGWRVRGAARYLRIKTAQREGGKKGRAASSSKVGTSRKTLKSTLGSTSGSTSTSTSGSAQALTPTTDDRTPTTESEKNAPRRRVAADGERQPDPRHAPMVATLCNAYEQETGDPYKFGSSTDKSVAGRNAKAVTSLLGMGTDLAIVSAWRRALKHTGFPTVRSLPELVTHFNHFQGRQATGPPKGAAGGSDTDWSDYKEGDTARELGAT